MPDPADASSDPRVLGPSPVATASTRPSSSSAVSALGGDEWPAQATDTIVNVVDKVRDKTTGPLTKIARGIVFGTLAAVLGLVALVMVCVIAIRLLNNYVFDHNVWAAYFVVGALFSVVAAFLATKAVAMPSRD